MLWVSPSGNDGNGDGTTAAPYQTLSRALDVAREYTITGRATLTVRLTEGEHILTDPVDLYHPQGSNLIVEGDPSAVAQRTLWRVDGYRWSPLAFAGGGHTANISLFNSGALVDAENHGFTASQAGQYFALTNAACGARSGYYTTGSNGKTASGIHSSVSSYDPMFWGDRFFNHGYSHEEGSGILGTGKILSVSSGETLGVEFHNINYDGRVPSWQMNGGISNSVTWGGVLNNYPETQYSEPNGYYGNSLWTTEDGSDTYPSKPVGVSHITPDPFLLTTYPVVIRGQYGSGRSNLFLKRGNLRALRNLFFVSSEPLYTAGSTASASAAITAISHQNRWIQTNGTAINLENANIAIRHIGVMGAGTALSAIDSQVFKYSDSTSDDDSVQDFTGNTGGSVRFASMGTLDNTPVICVSHCQNGIVSKGSVINFADGSGTNSEYRKDHRDCSVQISARSKGIALFSSNFRATTVNVNLSALVPNFKFDAYVPVFSGFTTNSFIRSESNTNYWYNYPVAVAYTTLADGVSYEIGHINWVEKSFNQTVSGLGGLTTGVTYLNNSAPHYWEKYTFYGLKTSNASLPFVSLADIRNGITAQSGVPLRGGTFTVQFYGAADKSVVSSSMSIGRNSVYVTNDMGTSFGVNGISVSTSGNLAAAVVQSFSSYGATDTYMGNVFEDRTSALQVYDGSRVLLEKALVVNNGGVVPVEVAKSSSLVVGDSLVSANPYVSTQSSGQTETLFGNFNYNTGALCITGYANSAIYGWDNSSLIIGSVFTKHPTPVNCFVEHDLSSGHAKVIKLDQCCNGVVGSLYSLLTPGNSSVVAQNSTDTFVTVGTGLWKSRTGIGYGFMPFDTFRLNGYVLVERNSSLILELEAGNKVFHFDGGSPVWSGNSTTPRNASLISAKYSSSVLLGNCQDSSVSFTQSNLKSKFTVDVRASENQKIASRSTGSNTSIYNTSGVSRAWAGESNGSSTFIPNDINIGNYSFMLSQTSGVAQRDLPPAAGITYCTSFSGFSKVISI